MPQIQPSEVQTFASIKVVGVGGAGGGHHHGRGEADR